MGTVINTKLKTVIITSGKEKKMGWEGGAQGFNDIFKVLFF